MVVRHRRSESRRRLRRSTPSKKTYPGRNHQTHEKSIFDAAVEMVDGQIEWINWDNRSDMNSRLTCSALAILYSTNLAEIVPEVTAFFWKRSTCNNALAQIIRIRLYRS